MLYREAIEWCEEHCADINFNCDEVIITAWPKFRLHFQVRDATFLTAVMKAMKLEEEEQHGS